jgi:hypothetical protein
MKKVLWTLPLLIVAALFIKWNSIGRLSDFDASVVAR